MSPQSTPSLSPSSLAEKFRNAPQSQRKQLLDGLSEAESYALFHDWDFWARPNQKLPPGDWSNWLVLAGRGFGKTRVGAETVRIWARDNPLVNIIGPTASDARDIMVEGPSGILAVCAWNERPQYLPSKRQLLWPNGAKSLIFSADEPERLRGPNHYKLWGDELAAWRYQEDAFDQAMFGLRLGIHPQAVFTTTPKPTKLLKQLMKSSTTVISHGTTYENRSNLAPSFYSQIITKHEGTRLGRQELNAEVLEENPGALWSLSGIDGDRVKQLPTRLTRIIVGVDPAVSANDESDLTGIVIAGMGPAPNGQEWPPHFYVIDDLSLKASPDQWAATVVKAYQAHKADRIVAEVNNGGDLVEAILRTKHLEFAYSAVHASRGKLTRAEPIAALYEQHRVHHVGSFGPLEDQMCDYVPLGGQKSPDRMDALVWALWALSEPEAVEFVHEIDERPTISPELDDIDFRSF